MGFEMKCVPVLEKMPCCCCSCDLKIATCILGWFALVGNIGNFLRAAVFLAMSSEDNKDVLPQDSEGALIGALVSSAVGLIVVVLLLYGAHNEKAGFVLPYVILDLIGIVIAAVVVVVFSIMAFISSFLVGFLILIFGGLLIALASFFWVVVYSYYRKLEEHKYPFPATSLGNVVSA